MDRMRFEVIGELCGADSVTYLASTFSQWPAAGVAAALFPSRHRHGAAWSMKEMCMGQRHRDW